MCTRPDITFAVNYAANFQIKPEPIHITLVKGIFRYLRGTTNLGLTYFKRATSPMFCAVDASHKNEPDQKSRTGLALFRGGAAFLWKSSVQTATATSSTDAEYRAASLAGRKIIWARELLNELGIRPEGATKMQCDNQPTVRMLLNLDSHGRTEHIPVGICWVNEIVESGEIVPEWIPTGDNSCDMHTKPLTGEKFNEFRDRMLGDPSDSQYGLKKNLFLVQPSTEETVHKIILALPVCNRADPSQKLYS